MSCEQTSFTAHRSRCRRKNLRPAQSAHVSFCSSICRNLAGLL